jgi:hypothetical protein
MNITNLYIMKDYSKQIEELQQFINDRLIISKNENDYVLCSDIHFFINENKDYKDEITRITSLVVGQHPTCGLLHRKAQTPSCPLLFAEVRSRD